MKKYTLNITVGLLAINTANAALVAGADQRYQASNYTVGSATWNDSIGTAHALTANAGGFSATTTANGTAALQNDLLVPGTVDGDVFSFTRASSLASTGQFTVQSVIRIDDNVDDRSGPFALDQASGWSGLYAGANTDGNNAIRGGNVGNSGGPADVINGSGGTPVVAGTWGIYTLLGDATVTSPQLTYSFVEMATGTTLFSGTIDSVGGQTATTLGLSNNGVLFGGEQGGGAAATNGWGGAIADVVVYDTLLSAADIATNEAEFIDVYQTVVVPEPSSTALLGLGGLALVMRRRK